MTCECAVSGPDGVGTPLTQAEAVHRHEGGAGSCAAGQGRAGPPLPHAHHQMVGAEHLHEMHVGAGWEGRVMLEQWAEQFQIDLLHHRHRNHHMGVTHAGGRHRKCFAIHLQLTLG